jgi:hypothetical protein
MSQKVDFRGRKGAKNEMENKEKRIWCDFYSCMSICDQIGERRFLIVVVYIFVCTKNSKILSLLSLYYYYIEEKKFCNSKTHKKCSKYFYLKVQHLIFRKLSVKFLLMFQIKFVNRFFELLNLLFANKMLSPRSFQNIFIIFSIFFLRIIKELLTFAILSFLKIEFFY